MRVDHTRLTWLNVNIHMKITLHQTMQSCTGQCFFLRHTCSTHVVWRNKKNYGILFHGVYVIVRQFRFLKHDNIFTDTDDSQDIKGREGIVFYPTVSLPPAHEHWDIYLQLCIRDDYQVFLIETLVFIRFLLNEIYHLIELQFDWLIDDAMFVCLIEELFLGFLFQRFNIGNWLIRTRACIDYHPCITSEPTNQVC